jgi:hypothetical protein
MERDLAKWCRCFAVRPKTVSVPETGIQCLVIFLHTSVYECCNLQFKYVRRHNAIYSILNDNRIARSGIQKTPVALVECKLVVTMGIINWNSALSCKQITQAFLRGEAIPLTLQ